MSGCTFDRCAVCRTTIHLDWSAVACPGGHVICCEGCNPVDACNECDPATTTEERAVA